MTRTKNPTSATFRFPVLMAVFIAVMLGSAAINNLVSPIAVLALPVGIGLAAAAIACYRRVSRAVERRPEIAELDPATMWSGLRRGALLGSGLFVLLMLVITIFGGLESVSWGSIGGSLAAAGMMASVAVTEEVLFCGILFRIMEQRLGTVTALVISCVLFGLTHLVNVNATLWGTLSIALTGGVMMTAAYFATRSLWLPIGLHFAWNFTHAGIFGIVLSGSETAPHGLLSTALSGPSVLTGGTFGPEASLFSLLVCAIPTVILLRRASRAGQIIAR